MSLADEFIEDTVETDSHVKLPTGYFHEDSGKWFRFADIREMNGNDEEAMSDPKVVKNGGKILTTLLASCVKMIGPFKGNPIMMRQLITGDRDFLLLKIRQLSFGDKLTFAAQCPNCKAEVSRELNLAETTVKYADEPALDFKLKLTKGIEFDGVMQKDAVIRFPNGEILELLSQAEYRENLNKGKSLLLLKNLKEVGSIAELSMNLIRDMTSADRNLITDEIMKRMPRPDFDVEIECSSCGAKVKSSLGVNHFLAQS